ncbi:MAG: NAD(P)/FAD-dependent oxidoreductase [Rhodospirillaceae bacterium]|nr:NAD(P)/FAD-dependent oxidoreductase [Rhodospirillaceae bacterium]MBT4773430.1 NAD(P)/FAD-dependent oxidoreductase [Rhodospirillaceae bacterium]MBT5359954.1 NAD(P)/FAD-dependent oxidoreductase [Rhodospirillaceae bacterium]MBT5769403.1 NAD(P)/FAD-dependent oxidoreductase [Rhodospirillaceae bacterium]MBT6310165.1 NAD(P)/FAD-dependent oxidoreductase [Rhodospirillaceae bacterium]
MRNFDVIIIGAGAAGLMCAAEANRRGRRVLVLERAANVAQKIRISGGGRANFTNLYATPDDYLSANPRFCVSALSRYTQHDFIALVERHGIAYHERDHGQLFCDGSAQQIIDLLLAETSGVTIETAVNISRVAKDAGHFSVETDRGAFAGDALVIATGGPSIPKMGASRFGYDIARQFGLNVIEPRPGLVPLTFDAAIMEKIEGLAGVSLDATVTLGKVHFTEALLFTHRGLSGPAILQISSYWRDGETIKIDLLPGTDLFGHLKNARATQSRMEMQTALARLIPKRLAQRMVVWADCGGRLADTSDKSLRRLAEQVNAWRITPNGSEGNRTAEVTVGGVDTSALSSKTMEATAVPGLYFIGEAVDVTGHLGGFNFQWAWASGHACGQAV